MTRITTPFGAHTTAAEIVDGVSLDGRRAIVTGGASGLGVETARALALAGADVTLAVRDTEAGDEVAADIIATTGNEAVRASYLDLTKHDTLRAFAAGVEGPLHMLVDNAGVMATPLTRTPEGWELQFANNHLGHFVLARELRTALARGAEEAGVPSRIVSLSSTGHHTSPVVFDDIMFERREYDPWSAYGQSKTANVLFAVGVESRWGSDGIVANAVHPGGIMTALQRHLPADEPLKRGWIDAEGRPNPRFKNVEQGAATSVLLAASPLVEGVTGRYFEDANEAIAWTEGMEAAGVKSYALDPEAADRLWTLSEQLVGA
ncbi:SDR family NAD(P)-dependent oxidoreductase [Frigoribacterium sp. 2-23]|uniref:SDR family NAD(P)-dependent oxidoreductase n=1 Tax=Frigoribacterium sp. 2-23 TaxID=3415006 RepID=UPI003C6FD01A